MNLESAAGIEDDRSIWIRMQRHFYKDFLDGRDLSPWPPEEGGPGRAELTPECREGIRASLAEVHGLLELLSQQGRLLAVAPRPALKQKFMAYWRRVQGVLENNPRLAVVGHLWMYETQTGGEDLERLMAQVERYLGLSQAMIRAL
jgi:hypothetical protein